jgi:hypothetical protein
MLCNGVAYQWSQCHWTEAYQTPVRVKLTKFILPNYQIFYSFPPCSPPSLRDATRTPIGIGRGTVVNTRAIHLITRPFGLSERLLSVKAKIRDAF